MINLTLRENKYGQSDPGDEPHPQRKMDGVEEAEADEGVGRDQNDNIFGKDPEPDPAPERPGETQENAQGHES